MSASSTATSATAPRPERPRVHRKPAPKFEYSLHYPEPDPDDPFAPLSVLRNRAANPISTPPRVAAPALTRVTPIHGGVVGDLSTVLLLHQQNTPDSPRRDGRFAGQSFQKRMAAVLAEHERITPQRIGSPVPIQKAAISSPSPQRVDRRSRTLSVFGSGLRSSAKAPDVPLPTKAKAEPRMTAAPSASSSSTTLGHDVSVYQTASSNSSSSDDSASESSQSSASKSFNLEDFADYPIQLLHKIDRLSLGTEPLFDNRPNSVKSMHVMEVDLPQSLSSSKRSFEHSPSPASSPEPKTPPPEFIVPEPVSHKQSRMSLVPRFFSRTPTPQAVTLPTPPYTPPSLPSTASSSSSTSSQSAGHFTLPQPPVPASADLPPRPKSPFSRLLSRKSSGLALAESQPESLASLAKLEDRRQSRVRTRTLSRRITHSTSSRSMKHLISAPVTEPVSLPMFAPLPVPAVPQLKKDKQEQPVEAEPQVVKTAVAVTTDIIVPPTEPISRLPSPIVRSASLSRPAPIRPRRSHLRSISDPSALASAIKASLAQGATPSPLHTEVLVSPVAARPVPAPLHLEDDANLSARYQPSARSPAPPSKAERPPSVLSQLPVVPLVPSPRRARARAMTIITPPQTPPKASFRPRSGSFGDIEGTAPVMPLAPAPRMGLPSNPRGNRPALSRARPQASFYPNSHSHTHADAPVGVVGLGTLPGPAQLANAARMEVLKENGLPVTFGALWKEKRTIIVFIRHFWCAMCQDYLASIMRDVDHAAMKRSGVQLIVIGCGSFNLIKSYRQIFRLPYQIFVDPSPGQQLYRALGMACMAPAPVRQRNGKAERGEYVKHGAMGGLAMVWKNALKVGMPVWEKGGDAGQLGGEFILGPGLTCTYAHRMQNARTHAPIGDVLTAAGVPFVLARPGTVTRVHLPRRSIDSGSDFEEIKLPSQMASLAEEYGVVIGIAQTDSVGWDSNASGESGVIVHAH